MYFPNHLEIEFINVAISYCKTGNSDNCSTKQAAKILAIKKMLEENGIY